MKLDKLCKHCKKYNNCKEGYVQRFKDLTHTLYFCPKFLYNDGNPITNADRIRSMSDAELASFLRKTVYEQADNLFNCEDYKDLIICSFCKECEAFLYWLQSEVEE